MEEQLKANKQKLQNEFYSTFLKVQFTTSTNLWNLRECKWIYWKHEIKIIKQ